MQERGKSDMPVVPAKSLNKATSVAAEVMEGRGHDQGEHGQRNTLWTQGRTRRAKCAGSCASGSTTG